MRREAEKAAASREMETDSVPTGMDKLIPGVVIVVLLVGAAAAGIHIGRKRHG